MNLRNHLLREAGRLASSQTVRRIELWVDIARLEARSKNGQHHEEIDLLRNEAENCGQALIRFGQYRPHQEDPPACPFCWVVKGERAILQARAPTEEFRCNSCGAAYSDS